MKKLDLVRRVIGFTSLGLGVAALLSTQRPARKIAHGGKDPSETLAAVGAREVAAGAALLAPVTPGPILWARIAGDLANIGGIVAAWRKPGPDRLLLGLLTTAAVAAVAIDLIATGRALRHAR